jgi:hypothetical protein
MQVYNKKEVFMKRKRKGNFGIKIIAAILIVLFAVYIGVSIYFIRHFSFNTYVDDIPAYQMTAEDLEKAAADELKEYYLMIHARGGITDVITSQDVRMSLEMDGQFEEALRQQNPFLWPKYLFSDTNLTTENLVVYSRDDVEEKLASLKIFNPDNIVEPTDAHIPDESGDEGFMIVPEDYGQSPIKSEVLDTVCAAIDVLSNEVTLGDECYKAPKILSDDPELVSLCENLNTYCKARIKYEFGSDSVIVDGTKIKEWCVIDGTSVSLDEEKVTQFVKDLSRKYDTFGRDRTITSHSGSPVTISGGDYGWWMDRATEATELIEAIKRGDNGVRTPVYFGTAAQYGDNDWGNSYVEIDLSAQHLWVYQDGAMVIDSDFVSGCVNKKNPTPRGSYAITYKERDATLVGENYASAVKYWMPFNGNVGMHDASWRSHFGGNEYILNGSHGCINLPTAKAAAIFDVVSKGEAVFVYGGLSSPVPTVEREVVDPATGEVKTIRVPVTDGSAPAKVETPPQETPTAAAAEESTPENAPEQAPETAAQEQAPEELTPEETEEAEETAEVEEADDAQ